MGNTMKIAVMGGGNSAQTMAADLALAGHDVTLCDLPRFAKNIRPLMEKREIEKCGSLGTTGRTGLAKLKKVTTDVGDAVRRVDLIMIAVPAYGHLAFYKAFADCLEDGQGVLILPGNWGALRLFNLLERSGNKKKVWVAETNRCMHICRAGEHWLGPGKVRVVLERGTVQVAAMPGRETRAVLDILKPLYANLAPAKNVLETSLGNSNIVLHGPLVLMNAGWIEHTAGQFMIYRDGVTPSVGKMMDAIGNEQEAILKALGFTPSPRKPFYDQIKDSDWVKDPCEVGPPHLQHRYISEDIPYGLVPLTYWGDLLGVPTPASDAMIEVSSIANQVNYRKEGLTLRALGSDGLTPKEILKRVNEG
jgi:opine dehydrogenase